MTNDTKQILKARAILIRDLLTDRKIDPDPMTAAALLYLALSILKLPADDVIANLPDALRTVTGALARHDTRPDDPNAVVTLTQAELATLIHTKVGSC